MNSSRCVAGLCFWFANITVRAREERSVRRHLLCFTRATREDNKKKSARNWKKVTVNSRGKGCLRKHFGYGKETQEEKSKSLKLTSISHQELTRFHVSLCYFFCVLFCCFFSTFSFAFSLPLFTPEASGVVLNRTHWNKPKTKPEKGRKEKREEK